MATTMSIYMRVSMHSVYRTEYRPKLADNGPYVVLTVPLRSPNDRSVISLAVRVLC
jgi:hypothetical protein